MRTTAQICKIAMFVKSDCTVFQTAYQINFIFIPFFEIEIKCFIFSHFGSDIIILLPGQFKHFIFDRFKIGFADRYAFWQVNIIIKTALQGWSNP